MSLQQIQRAYVSRDPSVVKAETNHQSLFVSVERMDRCKERTGLGGPYGCLFEMF